MKYVSYLHTGNWHDQWSISILWLFLWPWPSVNFRLWPYSDVIFPMINICNMFSGIHCLQVNVNYVILSWCLHNNEFITCSRGGGHMAMTLTTFNLDLWLDYYRFLFYNNPQSNVLDTVQFDTIRAMCLKFAEQ